MSTRSPSSQIRSLFDLLDAFPTEQACVEHLERLRWPDGPVCPWCETTGRAYRIKLRWKCAYCRQFFSVRKGTAFEHSRISLRKWFAAIFLFTSSRKGIPSYQLAREIGVRQKTAWYMLCRLRQVADKMSVEVLKGIVEVDECYVGGRNRNRHSKKKFANWADGFQVVVGAVERDGNVILSRVPSRDREDLWYFIMRYVFKGSEVHTDELASYKHLPLHKHKFTTHSQGQYVDGNVHSQTIESVWAIVKRAHKGTYHQWTRKHFDLYLREFEMRWNMRRLPEGRRLDVFLSHVDGTRLAYKDLVRGRRQRPRKVGPQTLKARRRKLRRQRRARLTLQRFLTGDADNTSEEPPADPEDADE